MAILDNILSGELDGAVSMDGNSHPTVSTATHIYNQLRRRIISLDLPPDTHLTRTELAQQYKVSQTPLREAMQRLDSEGLIKVFPQSRTVVTRIDPEQIHGVHFLRVAVECEVVLRLAKSCDREALDRLETIIKMQEAVALNSKEITVFQELDELFHMTMMACVGQAALHTLLRSRSGHLDRVRRLDLPNEGKVKTILTGHHDIVNAIATRDAQAAVAAIREHLSQTVSRVNEFRKKYPDYFTADARAG